MGRSEIRPGAAKLAPQTGKADESWADAPIPVKTLLGIAESAPSAPMSRKHRCFSSGTSVRSYFNSAILDFFVPFIGGDMSGYKSRLLGERAALTGGSRALKSPHGAGHR